MAKTNKKMTRINRKPATVKQMNADFDQIQGTLSTVAVSSEKLMPLFSDSIKLSLKILGQYKEAFNSGTKYAKK